MRRMRVRRLVVVGGVAVLLLAAIVCGWFALQFRAMLKATRPVADVGEYGRVLGEWKEFAGEIVGHFPEAVPADAEDVSFYFWPGFLQSDARIELRFRTGHESIDRYYETFSKRATKFTSGAMLIHFVRGRGQADVTELGPDYVVMQFDADPNNIPEHGKEHGVIMSREKNEIIFWAEW